MRLLFAGTPEFGLRILEALIASDHEVLCVMTQPSRPKGRGQWSQASPVAVRAQKESLPIITTSPSKPRVLDQIRALDPEAIVVAAYGRIFRPEFLALPRRGVINVHPSLLPRWRGAAPVHAALLAGDKVTGVSIIGLVQAMDAGPVYAMEKIDIVPEDDRGSLEAKLAEQGSRLVLKVLQDIASDQAQPQDQDDSQATYTPKKREEDARIRWDETAFQCWNRVRAFAPDPCAWFKITGKQDKTERVKILAARVYKPSAVNQTPSSLAAEIASPRSVPSDSETLLRGPGGKDSRKAGVVLGKGSDQSLLVSCASDTTLELLLVRPQGKKDQPADSLVHGKKISIGQKLL